MYCGIPYYLQGVAKTIKIIKILKRLKRNVSLLYIGYRVFPGGKVRPGCDADSSPPFSAEVKNRVELYLYSP